MLIPVVLAGGGGTRLWPYSRRNLPKPFLPLLRSRGENRSMLARNLQLSHAIAQELNPAHQSCAPIIVGAQKHRRLLEHHSENIEAITLLLEPVARSTAASVALAALDALANFPDKNPLLFIVAADIYVADSAAWRDAVQNTIAPAQNGDCVVLGIEATSPRTDFAYLRVNDEISSAARPVEAMILRPNENDARDLIASGALWSSGIYCIAAQTIVQELEKQSPQILACCRVAYEKSCWEINHFSRDNPGTTSQTIVKINRAALKNCPAQSLDEAIFRNASKRASVQLRGEWNDVGTWRALHELSPHDENGNSAIALDAGHIRLHDCRNCTVQAGSRTVAVLGMEDVVVIETPDAVLVLPRSRAHEAALFSALPSVQVLAEGMEPEATTHSQSL